MPEATTLEEIASLARSHDAVNLAQGFPDTPGPADIRASAAAALIDGPNQYPPVRGMPELRSAVAAHYGEHQNFVLSPDQVLITSGGTEALAASILALVAPGDDVLVIEPMYDAYAPLVQRAGAAVRPVRLSPPCWRLDETALRKAMTPATRVLLLSQPANPMSRVFDDEERSILARFCVEHDLIVISDEVWEHILFDGAVHRSLASYPGMSARTVKLGSAGKILSLTGWKVGFVCAEAFLLDQVARMHQCLTFSTPPNLQTAVAYGLRRPKSEFIEERMRLAASRERLARQLSESGFAVLPSQATYFLYVDLPESGIRLNDAAFCRLAIVEAGVATIPVSLLYSASPLRTLIRICFARTDAVLDEGTKRLAVARGLV
ncbi:aminotransferase [Rhizobium sullae]|uniref:Aminotransferase n=1 Tax=Rhizobium sullae TaxID=50338 RepID=A0A2N0D049_RHISU|nr:aminotransferase [Rhizobium sullae]PKA39479.1 aminotransferase [Rhizobium sullae]